MAPLKLCANISWLFTELPDFSQRMFASAAVVSRLWRQPGSTTPGCRSCREPERLQEWRWFSSTPRPEMWRQVSWVLEQFLAERQSSDRVWIWL
ncbi:hypothetical protein INR49_008686 [Caranx melampygus]|nr:hypothetical protein INR49_008686 [Caranx melampygus]